MVPLPKKKKLWYLPDGKGGYTTTETYQSGAVSSPTDFIIDPIKRSVAQINEREDEKLQQQSALPKPPAGLNTPLAQPLAAPKPLGLIGFDRTLRALYPASYAEGLKLSESPDDTTNMLLSTIQSDMKTNPDLFVRALRAKNRPNESKALLAYLGASQQDIDQILGQNLTELRAKAGFGKYAPPTFDKLVKDNPLQFVRQLNLTGRNQDTEALLTHLGASPEEINQIFAKPEVLPALDFWDKLAEIKKNPAQLAPYLSSGIEIKQMADLLIAAKHLEDNKATEADLKLLRDYVQKGNQREDISYLIADTVADIVPFALEFLITKGAYSVAEKATIKAGEKVLAKWAGKTGLKILEGKLAQLGVKAAGAVVGGTAQTLPAGGLRITASTLQKQLDQTLTDDKGDDEAVWQSAVKSLGEQWVETVSERSGGLLSPLTGAAKGKLLKMGLFKAFLTANPGKDASTLNKLIKGIGYNGVIGEMFEERVADVMHGTLNKLGLSGQTFKIPSVEQLVVELVSFSIPGAAFKVAEVIPGAITSARLNPERGSIVFRQEPEKAVESALKAKQGVATPTPSPTTEPSVLTPRIQQSADILKQAEQVAPTNPDVVAYKGMVDSLQQATTPAQQREILANIDRTGIEDRVKAVSLARQEIGQPEAGIQQGMFGDQKEVRPKGKGVVTQISLDDQLELKQYELRQAENIARSPELEIQTLTDGLANDPVARFRYKEGKRSVSLETLVNKDVEGQFPDYVSVRTASNIAPEQAERGAFAKYTQKGLPTYNKVPVDAIFDGGLAQEWGFENTEQLQRHIEQIVKDRVKLRDLQSGEIIDNSAEVNQLQAEVSALEKQVNVPPADVTGGGAIIPPDVPQSVSIAQPSGTPKEIDRIIDLATEQANQDKPGALTRLELKIPGLKQVMEYVIPAFKMPDNLRIALNADSMAKSYVGTQALPTYVEVVNQIRDAFGQDSLHGGKIDIKVENGNYVLSDKQTSVLEFLQSRNDMLLDAVVQGYGAEIGRFIPQSKTPVDVNNPIAFTLKDIADHNGIYLPNVDISEDVVEYLGSETRAVASGRGKTRIWQTAQERMAGKTPFKPELDVVKLLQGMDAFKSRVAGGQAFKKVIGGLNKAEVIEQTHPDLFVKWTGLHKQLTSLRGSARTLNQNVADAIDDFLATPIEDVDMLNLKDSLDTELKAGSRKGLDITAIKSKIEDTMALIDDLRPGWKAANPKPYVFVQEGLYRYYEADLAKQIVESHKASNNWLTNTLHFWRGGSFSGDLSPFGQQGHIALMAAPLQTSKAVMGGIRTAIEERDWKRSFTIDGMADDVEANMTLWGEFAALRGINLAVTPQEFAAGFMSKIPGFNRLTRATYIPLTRNAFWAWKHSFETMVAHGVPELEAKVAANQLVGASHLIANAARAGQSQARATFLRSLPTSYSFIAEPVAIITNGHVGFAKLLIGQKLTPKESMSLKVITTMAASVMTASIMSAVATAISQGKDDDEILKAVWDAVNPDPNNGKFASLIIGDARIALGGPYRSLFRAFWPKKIKGVPFPVPFAGLTEFLYNRVNPAMKTQLELWRNKDYYNQQIMSGNLPERILRGILYEFEQALPLTAGEVAEKLRRGEDYTDDLRQKVISQFMGVNAFTLDNTYLDRERRKLGLPKEEQKALPFGIQKPENYLTSDFWTAGNRVLSSRENRVGDVKGYDDPPLVKAIIEARPLKDKMDSLLNIKLSSLSDENWGLLVARQDLSGKELETFDKKYPQLANVSQRDFVLLRQREGITDKKQLAEFDNLHPELSVNPRLDWLKSRPKDNALLAVFGQAKILTKEAYNEFKKLVKELDIPDSALPDQTLPPEGSIDNYFKLQDMIADNKDSSWEAQLLLAKDDKLREFLGRKPTDTPIASLELKVKNREKFDKLDAFSDKDSPDYIADEKKRAEAVKKLKSGAFGDDIRRIEAIEKGTDKIPTPEPTVKAHVDYMKLQDKEGVGSSSAEVMLFRVDNPEYDQWRQDAKLWGDSALKAVDTTKIPGWRIDVKWQKEDVAYEEIKNDLPAKQAELRQTYLVSNPDYADDRRRREAYSMSNSVTGEKFPTGEVESYVKYMKIQDKPGVGSSSAEAMLYRVDNPTLDDALIKINGAKPIDTAKIPIWRIDVKYAEQDTAYQAILDKYGTKETIAQKKATLDYLKGDDEYWTATLQRDAYKIAVPDQHTQSYVDYRKKQTEGKPKDYPEGLPYYEDDWWMMEHPEFYKEVYLGIMGNERKNFIKVPTREVFAIYEKYDKARDFQGRIVNIDTGQPALPDSPNSSRVSEQEALRLQFPELDAWGVLAFGWKPLKATLKEAKRKSTLSPKNKLDELVYTTDKSFDERMAILRGGK